MYWWMVSDMRVKDRRPLVREKATVRRLAFQDSRRPARSGERGQKLTSAAAVRDVKLHHICDGGVKSSEGAREYDVRHWSSARDVVTLSSMGFGGPRFLRFAVTDP